MSISKSDYLTMLTRLDKNKVREPTEAKWVCKNGSKPTEGAPGGHGPYVTPGNCPECGIPLVQLNSRESTLHDSIIDYCNSQWPKWVPEVKITPPPTKRTMSEMTLEEVVDCWRTNRDNCAVLIWNP